MKPQQHSPDPITVALTSAELTLINNALNEVVNGVHFEADEFATRLGASRAQASQLLAKVGKLLTKK